MKKTNIRVHRNCGSKSVSPQVPNKPEAAAPQITGTAPVQERKLAPPSMEDAVQASAALTSLLFTHIESLDAATVVPMDQDTFNCGLMLLCKATNDNLLAAYSGVKKSRGAADRRTV